MVRRVTTIRFLALLCLLFAADLAAHAATVYIMAPGLSNGCTTPATFIQNPQTGTFAGLVAYSNSSCTTPLTNVLWTSSNPSSISVNAAGLATFLQASPSPVTITATSGANSGTLSLSVVPQTTLFTVDGTSGDYGNVIAYDITNGMAPAPFKTITVTYSGALSSSNGGVASLALSPDGTLLFVGNSSPEGGLEVINTTTLAQVTSPSLSTSSKAALAEACEPVSLATKGIYLYAVNAANVAGCGGLALILSYNEGSPPSFTYLHSVSTPGTPIVVAASVDPNDPHAYVGSTSGYSSSTCNASCDGYLTTITNASTSVTISSLSGSGYSIAPVGLTVATSYPSWSSVPVHTVAAFGSGYNSTEDCTACSTYPGSSYSYPSNTYGIYVWSMPDLCQATCNPTEPSIIYPESGPAYSPVPAGANPSGLNAYTTLGDSEDFLNVFNNSSGYFSDSGSYFSTGGSSTCGPPACFSLTSLAFTADGQHLFIGTAGDGILRLNPTTLAVDNTLSGVTPLAMAISQAPEITSTLVQAGTQSTISFTLNGNFQNQTSPATYSYGVFPIAGAGTSGGGSIVTSTANPNAVHTFSFAAAKVTSTTSGTTSCNTGVSGSAANQSSNSIICSDYATPTVVQINTPSSTTVLAAGGTLQLSVMTPTNQTNPDSEVWGATHGSISPGAPGSVPSGSQATYTAPSINLNPTTDVVTATSANADCTLAVPPNVCSGTLNLTIAAPVITLSGTGLTTSSSGGSLPFSTQTAGTTSSAVQVTVKNTPPVSAPIPLTISGSPTVTETTYNDFIISLDGCTNVTLANSGTCTFDVQFSPMAGPQTSRTAQLVISSNAFNNPQTITLTGTAVTPATAVYSPTSTVTAPLSCGSQTENTTSVACPSVTLTNGGSVALTVSGLSLGGTNPGDFAETNNCTSVAGGSTCTIGVTFKPTGTSTSTTTRSATLVVTDSASNSPQTLYFSGTANPPPPAVTLSTAGPLIFPSVAQGSTSTVPAVTLTNTGGSALSITSIGYTGANPGDFGETNNCGTSVAAGASCTINSTFTPATAAGFSAVLTLTDNASTSPQTINVSGTGLTNTPGAVLSTAGPLNFGGVFQGVTSSAQTVILTNPGGVALTVTSISFTGTNPGDFSQTNNCTPSVASLGTCTINVTFKPAALLGRSATLTLTDNASTTPQTISVTGTGSPTPAAVSLSATSYPFGSEAEFIASTPEVFVLTNTGGASLTISSFTFGGANPGDFTQTNTCLPSVAGGATCNISVTFDPTAIGSRTATLTLTDNALPTTQVISLSGTGVGAPAVSLSSSGPLSFGSVIEGNAGTPQPVTLTNTGGAALSVSGIAFTGANPGDFGQTNNCPPSVAAGAACTINITFTPATVGARSATLTLTDNASPGSQTVGVTGSGAPIVVNITPSTAPSVVTGATIPFSAKVVGSTNQAVTWTVTGTGCSGGPCGSINSTTGVYSAPAALPSIQSVTDTVVTTAKADPTQSASIAVTVQLANPVSLTISPAINLVVVGASVQFSTQVQSVTNQSVTWQVTSGGGSISAGGLYTAPVALPSSGAVTVTAVSAADPTKSASVSFTLFSVALNPVSAATQAGGTQGFTALVLPSGLSPNVTWSLSGAGCSGTSCGTLSNITGTSVTFTASSAVTTASVVEITATPTANTAVSVSAPINVFLAPVISTTGQSATVTPGQPASYSLALAPGSGDPNAPLTIECDPNYVPTGVTCSTLTIQPSVTAQTFTLKLTTTGSQNALLAPPESGSFAAASLGLLFPFGVILISKRRAGIPGTTIFRLLLLTCFLLPVGLIAICGCGSSGPSNQSTNQNFGATPSGTYTIQIDGVGPSGIPQEIGNVTLIVN